MCLNGVWEFQFDSANEGLQLEYYSGPILDREIKVPFAYQTRLSAIDEQWICEVVWYAKSFTVPEDWGGRSVLLHFGAVDYEATVWINGVQSGSHRGGYVPFTLDVTRLLKEGENRVVLRVVDSQDPGQPRGKQASSGLPHGIDYWCTTGIWQSVWLEPVSPSYVGDVLVSGDIQTGTLYVTPVIYGSRADIDTEISVLEGEQVLLRQVVSTTFMAPVALKLEEPKLWRPEAPHLYGLEIKLIRNGQVIDTVRSYAGLRSIETREGSILLNDQPIYLKMVLDQGYWPNSGLTAPTDEAFRLDIELVKKLGFNAVRKHQKVEDPRWLYWCDVLGLLVWGEMANARAWSFETQERLESEWARVVERDLSHPCIIAWVPVNESMGFPHLGAGDAREHAGIERLVHLTRRLDPSRPVIDNDGWEQTDTSDILAIHDYSHSGTELKSRYLGYLSGDRFPERIWSGSRITLLPGVEQAGRPIMLTEIGGFLMLPQSEGELDHLYKVYSSTGTTSELLDKYRELMMAIGSLPFLSGFCYTQFTDVEQEQNGLLTFDRQPKLDIETVAEIHRTMLS